MFLIKKISKKTLITVIVVAVVAILLGLRFSACSIVPSTATASIGTYSLLAETDTQRIAFLDQFGWTVDKQNIEKTEIIIPEEFNDVYNNYNEIQIKQGLNLEDYKGKACTKYTYRVTNYKDSAVDVQATLIVYEDKVIAGDICDVALGGFMTTLIKE